MVENSLVQPKELAERITAESRRATADRRLRIYDATVAFRVAGDGSLSAEADRGTFREEHLPGAAFVDHQEDLSRSDSGLSFTLLAPADLQTALRRLGICRDSSVVIYSTAHMMWATRLWWILHSCGLTDVAVLDGGLSAWKAEGLPVTSEAATLPPGDIEITFDETRWADRDQVLAAVGEGEICTLNALSAAAHEGSDERHYGRPGHIRGSVNLPFDALVQNGRLVESGPMRSHFERLGALRKDRVITYCGGGIAATLAAFALTRLGHPNVAVYDGSLSEWSADPALPMDTGGAGAAVP